MFPMFMHSQPGSDSGTTAVVALIRGKQLIVANAGDSRCVVSERGTSKLFGAYLPWWKCCIVKDSFGRTCISWQSWVQFMSLIEWVEHIILYLKNIFMRFDQIWVNHSNIFTRTCKQSDTLCFNKMLCCNFEWNVRAVHPCVCRQSCRHVIRPQARRRGGTGSHQKRWRESDHGWTGEWRTEPLQSYWYGWCIVWLCELITLD